SSSPLSPLRRSSPRPAAASRRVRASGVSSRPSAIPAAWLPWPGKVSATRKRRLLGDDDLAPVVRPAVAADVVRPLELPALLTGHEARPGEGEVGATAVATRLGDAFLGYCHGASGGARPCWAAHRRPS